MSLDSASSSEIEKSGAPLARSSWITALWKPTWVFVICTAASSYVAVFLTYSSPTFSFLLFLLGLVCWLPLSVLSLVALFRRRWRAVAIFAIAWMLIASPFLGAGQPVGWLMALGFRMHAFPLKAYLAKCIFYDFAEDGKKQTVGACHGGYDDGVVIHAIFYDTSRQFGLPASQRTQAWKQAVSHFTESDLLINSDNHARHLFGNFYDFGMNISEMKGG